MMYIIIGIYGLLLGSFFNVVGFRIPKGKSIVSPRSACSKCSQKLSWIELIPFFSYMMQKGTCRKCGQPISPLYPTIELLTAVLFVFAYFVFGFSMGLVVALTLISLLVIITITDLTYTMIPDKLLFFFFLLFFAERLVYPLDPWWNSLMGGVVAFLVLYVIAFVSQGGMGGGDIKLFTLIGFAVGLKVFLLSFFLATLFAAIYGSFGILFGKMKKKSVVPFGPFIAVGTLLSFFFYESIMDVYLSLFLI
ncbi:prepilin peptidase [Pueribacillus theae]|uniref:Prepilin peptidase n=1 Tax=Pueribacillus theae TaxID=2171751 RepID=A0A2U1JZI2_9BACI|nr:A24 family peptidase [Pueribacillus theae]PWA10650.1 prepilin peptidase [Pueribacillus theae]